MVENPAELKNTIKALGKAVSTTVPLFVIFSDAIYDRLIERPLLVTYSGATMVCILLCLIALTYRRWPKKFELFRNGIKNVLGQLSDSLFSFVLVGLVIRAFYPLDVALLPFYQNWWVWLIFFLEANLLLSLWSFKNHQDLHWRAVKLFWNRLN